MFLVAAMMATVSIIVISAAKIMIGVLVIFAPIAIACTLFKVTAPLFDRWVNLALGFAFYPMLTSGMAAFTIAIARDLTPASLASVETIGDVLSFVVVMMLGTGLMAMVPTIAQSLASTATVSAASQPRPSAPPIASRVTDAPASRPGSAPVAGRLASMQAVAVLRTRASMGTPSDRSAGPPCRPRCGLRVGHRTKADAPGFEKWRTAHGGAWI